MVAIRRISRKEELTTILQLIYGTILHREILLGKLCIEIEPFFARAVERLYNRRITRQNQLFLVLAVRSLSPWWRELVGSLIGHRCGSARSECRTVGERTTPKT